MCVCKLCALLGCQPCLVVMVKSADSTSLLTVHNMLCHCCHTNPITFLPQAGGSCDLECGLAVSGWLRKEWPDGLQLAGCHVYEHECHVAHLCVGRCARHAHARALLLFFVTLLQPGMGNGNPEVSLAQSSLFGIHLSPDEVRAANNTTTHDLKLMEC